MGVEGDGCVHRWGRGGVGMLDCRLCADTISRIHQPARFASAFQPSTGPADVVYVVRAGEDNEWLRHSLRTLANVPHRHVWIAGYRPAWVADTVGYIPTSQALTSFANSTGNLEAAARHDGLAERFVLMNDDFFIMRPVVEIPAQHRGLLGQNLTLYGGPGAAKRRGMDAVDQLLRVAGCDEPLYNYELHSPMMFERARLLEVFALADQAGGDLVPRFTRTRYGNYWAVGGAQVADCKVRRTYGQKFDTAGLFLSTSPESWRGGAGQYVRSLFPNRCVYERDARPARQVLRPYTPRATSPRAVVAR